MSRRAPSVLPMLHRGGLPADRAPHRTSRGCRALSLTREESGILEMLLAADGALASAEDLLEHVPAAHAGPVGNIVSVTMTPALCGELLDTRISGISPDQDQPPQMARTRRPATLPPPLTHIGIIWELG
jgi:hypothetical protein